MTEAVKDSRWEDDPIGEAVSNMNDQELAVELKRLSDAEWATVNTPPEALDQLEEFLLTALAQGRIGVIPSAQN